MRGLKYLLSDAYSGYIYIYIYIHIYICLYICIYIYICYIYTVHIHVLNNRLVILQTCDLLLHVSIWNKLLKGCCLFDSSLLLSYEFSVTVCLFREKSDIKCWSWNWKLAKPTKKFSESKPIEKAVYRVWQNLVGKYKIIAKSTKTAKQDIGNIVKSK